MGSHDDWWEIVCRSVPCGGGGILHGSLVDFLLCSKGQGWRNDAAEVWAKRFAALHRRAQLRCTVRSGCEDHSAGSCIFMNSVRLHPFTFFVVIELLVVLIYTFHWLRGFGFTCTVFDEEICCIGCRYQFVDLLSTAA